MDLSLSPAQIDVQELALRLLADASARDAEPLGHSPALWRRLADTGICGMGLPESAGGGDAGLDLLVVVAEEIGRTLAPVPVIEHTVAGRLLARVAPDDDRLPAIAAGSLLCTLAVRPAVDGTSRVVPAGAVADLVLSFEGDDLCVLQGPPPAQAGNLASAPLADRVGPGTVVASGAAARDAYEAARDEWRVLTAAALIGMAGGALALAVAYVKERHQFNRPIGSFQALQHGLADLVPSIDGGRILAHEAAWALQTGEASQRGATGAELAIMALFFASDTARLAADRCVQYHGGYGYAMEQDPQLFYRKARGLSLMIGPDELGRLADLTLGAH